MNSISKVAKKQAPQLASERSRGTRDKDKELYSYNGQPYAFVSRRDESSRKATLICTPTNLHMGRLVNEEAKAQFEYVCV